jgi:ATP-binding cassette subfamily B protein
MLRQQVRLVILDEPFRGLDREKRRELLARARRLWCGATLICITHDISETQDFEQVFVVEGGRIIEAGVPADLIDQPNSRYQALLKAEVDVRQGLWSGEAWRYWRLEAGELRQQVLRLQPNMDQGYLSCPRRPNGTGNH